MYEVPFKHLVTGLFINARVHVPKSTIIIIMSVS